jgi:hypothetical protein
VDSKELENRFTFHPASPETGTRHYQIRNMCNEMSKQLNEQLPEGREKALAITKLEELMMWANAAIARTS